MPTVVTMGSSDCRSAKGTTRSTRSSPARACAQAGVASRVDARPSASAAVFKMREIFMGSPPGRVAVKGPRVTPRRCTRRAPGRSCRWRSRSPPAGRPRPAGRRAWPARRSSSACCTAGAAPPQASLGYDRRRFVHNALQIVHASVGALRLLGWASGDERHRWPPFLALASRAPRGLRGGCRKATGTAPCQGIEAAV